MSSFVDDNIFDLLDYSYSIFLPNFVLIRSCCTFTVFSDNELTILIDRQSIDAGTYLTFLITR